MLGVGYGMGCEVHDMTVPSEDAYSCSSDSLILMLLFILAFGAGT